MASYLTSTQLAKQLAVSPATIRRWANSGLLPAERTAGGHRRFSLAVAERIARQKDGHQPGTDDWVRLLVAPGAPLAVDAALLAARCREDGWYVVAETIGKVLLELGVRWQRGHLSVVDEHIASSRLARALARVADSLPSRNDAPRALLAAAPGDHHTLGLSLVELVMRECGWMVTWIGQAVPTELLVGRIDAGGFDALAISASVFSPPEGLQRAASQISDACARRGADLVVGGRGAWPDQLTHGSVVRTFERLRAWMAGVDARRSRTL